MLRALNVTICRLDKTQQDVLNVLAYVPSLSETRGVSNAERHVKEARECLRKEGLP
jgi:hypothetical protein